MCVCPTPSTKNEKQESICTHREPQPLLRKHVEFHPFNQRNNVVAMYSIDGQVFRVAGLAQQHKRSVQPYRWEIKPVLLSLNDWNFNVAHRETNLRKKPKKKMVSFP